MPCKTIAVGKEKSSFACCVARMTLGRAKGLARKEWEENMHHPNVACAARNVEWTKVRNKKKKKTTKTHTESRKRHRERHACTLHAIVRGIQMMHLHTLESKINAPLECRAQCTLAHVRRQRA
jgi:hypothetical protein